MQGSTVLVFCIIVCVSCSTLHDVISIGKTTSRIPALIARHHTARARGGSRMNIWVFFTDKGPTHTYNSSLESVKEELHPKALWRRSKVNGKDVVDHSDLPVYDDFINGVLSTTGVQLRSSSKWLNAISVSLLYTSDELLHAALLHLVSLPYVKSIDVVSTYKRGAPFPPTTTTPPNEYIKRDNANTQWEKDFYGGSYTQLQQINVVQAHSQGYNGSGVIVMIADTGYLKTHPALPMDRVIDEFDFVKNDSDTSYEGDTHGTATFSNLGGWAPGVLIGSGFGAHFLLAKTEDSSTESIVEEDNFINALEWGEQRGAEIVSASLGYSNWYTFADMDGDTAPITVACDVAVLKGVVVVISNGNAANKGISAPADGKYVLSVGAVSDKGVVASFSSIGPSADGRVKPNVCAQGVNNYVADANTFGYSFKSGTSFSCPLTAGVVAILLQAHPNWTPAMVIEALTNTASLNSSPNINYGWGIIDTIAALNYSPRSGDCTNFACSNHGCCGNQTCACEPQYYGRDCSIKRVYCNPVWCKERNGSCQIQQSGLSFRCGTEDVPDDIEIPTCNGCSLDPCNECFGDSDCGCDNIPLSGAVFDVCGVCGGNSSCVHSPPSSPTNYILVGVGCFVGAVIIASIVVVTITYFKRQAASGGKGFLRLNVISSDDVLS